MATLSQLQAARTSAGATYASALTALKTAYIALAAADRALANRVFGTPVTTFPADNAELSNAIRMLEHPTYTPNQTHDWLNQINTSAVTHINGFTPG